jgi:hypothetical protein
MDKETTKKITESSDSVINKLINTTTSEDLLFLSAVIINILRKENHELIRDVKTGKSKQVSIKSLVKECSVLPEMFSTLGIHNTFNLIKYFGGETITVPSHTEMYESFLWIVCYYKHKIEGKNWDQIKEELPGLDISSHQHGKIIKKISDIIDNSFEDIKSMGIQSYLEKLTGVKNGK